MDYISLPKHFTLAARTFEQTTKNKNTFSIPRGKQKVSGLA
jgi:hypothetical protein